MHNRPKIRAALRLAALTFDLISNFNVIPPFFLFYIAKITTVQKMRLRTPLTNYKIRALAQKHDLKFSANAE